MLQKLFMKKKTTKHLISTLKKTIKSCDKLKGVRLPYKQGSEIPVLI